MSAFQPRVRLCRLSQWIDGCDRHAQAAFRHCALKTCKLAWPSHGIICQQANSALTFWFRLHAVGESNAAAFSYQSQAFFERLTGSEHERCIDSLGRQFAEMLRRFGVARIEHLVSSEFANQTHCLAAGGCPDHTSAATFGELHSERAYRAGCSVDQQRVAGTQAQILDPLQRR